MKHLQKIENLSPKNYIFEKFFDENCIFFDIETTGFSPANSICYLIGTLQRTSDKIIIDQFLASEKTKEKEVILSFLDILKNKTTIITFNGLGFDIPFLEAKCKFYGISFDFHKYQQVDIYKQISEIKYLLQLPNYKQKTIESFLGISREDLYSGGELISVYQEYIHSHSNELEHLLLLHNFEDVIGMLDLMPILSYGEFIKGAYTIDTGVLQPYTTYDGEIGKEIIITIKNNIPVPKQISHQFGEFYLTMKDNITKIRIPVCEGTLRYF
jgi:uncharacterized protein YprB with RNaseH-like and TPR domain